MAIACEGAERNGRTSRDQPIAWPKAEEASRAVREYLAALDAAGSDEDRGGDSGGKGGDRHKPPKEVSLTDPQATWVARPGLDPFFAYDANYLIDNKAGIILDAVGTRANRTVEIAITQTMVDRVERRFDLRPQRLAGDTVYGAVRLLKWLVDRNITPHVRVWDKSARTDGTFSRADFVFDQQRNIYTCPGGAELTSTGNIDQGHIVYYRASKSDCSLCSLKPKCTTATGRKITRDLNEDVRDRVRALADTEAFQQSRRERKKVEMRFAHMKRISGSTGSGCEGVNKRPARTHKNPAIETDRVVQHNPPNNRHLRLERTLPFRAIIGSRGLFQHLVGTTAQVASCSFF